MALTDIEKKTVEGYDRLAEKWAGQHNDKRFWGEEMDRFFELLPGKKVLEIGSGGGRDAEEIIRNGYDYVGTDVSNGLLKVARKRNPEEKFINTSIYDLDFPDNSFDGFWASAVFLHIPKSRIGEALTRLRNVVKPGGIGFISLKRGEGEVEEVQTFEDGAKLERLFAYYKDSEFSNVLKRNNYDVVESKEVKKGNTVWLVYIVRVNKQNL
jgi:ubiquinone/menaquinone biosynthesis C-methylase UbiE